MLIAEARSDLLMASAYVVSSTGVGRPWATLGCATSTGPSQRVRL